MFAYMLCAVESTCKYTLDAVVIELSFYVPKDIIFFYAILGAIFTKVWLKAE